MSYSFFQRTTKPACRPPRPGPAAAGVEAPSPLSRHVELEPTRVGRDASEISRQPSTGVARKATDPRRKAASTRSHRLWTDTQPPRPPRAGPRAAPRLRDFNVLITVTNLLGKLRSSLIVWILAPASAPTPRSLPPSKSEPPAPQPTQSAPSPKPPAPSTSPPPPPPPSPGPIARTLLAYSLSQRSGQAPISLHRIQIPPPSPAHGSAGADADLTAIESQSTRPTAAPTASSPNLRQPPDSSSCIPFRTHSCNEPPSRESRPAQPHAHRPRSIAVVHPDPSITSESQTTCPGTVPQTDPVSPPGMPAPPPQSEPTPAPPTHPHTNQSASQPDTHPARTALHPPALPNLPTTPRQPTPPTQR